MEEKRIKEIAKRQVDQMASVHPSEIQILIEEGIKEALKELCDLLGEEYEPHFGWCDVEGCENEGVNGGGCWRESGYWTVCSKHSSEYRAGNPQPQMKQSAIDREERRGADGVLVNEG